MHRIYTGSISINQTNLWITGGLSRHPNPDHSPAPYEILSSTEIIDAQYKTSTIGPELPLKLYQHCMVSISSSEAMIIGGQTGDPDHLIDVLNTYFYNFDTQKWTSGPVLNVKRVYSGCTVMTTLNNEKKIIVTGGFVDSNHPSMTSTEILDLNGDRWVYGPELPKPHHTHDMVSLADKVYVIAGGGRRSYENDYYNTIYEMDSTLKSWRLLKQRLIEPRYWPVAALIPDSATTCTKSKNQEHLNNEEYLNNEV